MTSEHAAFLSYSHHDADWVEALQNNLEAAVKALAHEPHEIFRDKTDLASGRSWVTQLQQGLDRSPAVIVVATPESMASHRVLDEWETFVSDNRDWAQGHLHVVHLVDCPLPPFLKRVHCVDFKDHDDRKYVQSFRALVGALIEGGAPRDLPEIPMELTVPPSPVRSVSPRDFREVFEFLARRLQSRSDSAAVAYELKIDRSFFESFPTKKCAASALLIEARGDDEELEGFKRNVKALIETFEGDLPDEVRRLKSIYEGLRSMRSRGGLEDAWLSQVQEDFTGLEGDFGQDPDLDLLARVYVELDVNLDAEQRAFGKVEDAERLGHGSKSELRQLLELGPGSPRWVTGRWVVLGDPGSGKTTLLRRLAASLAQEKDSLIPIFETIPRWLQEDPRPDGLWRRQAERLRRAGRSAQGFEALFARWAQDRRLLLLLDGLDEVAQEKHRYAEELLQGVVSQWPEARIVVASRPIGYSPLRGGFTQLRLLPLDRDRRGELLARWFGRESDTQAWTAADAALATLESSRSLWELAGNPLYLTLMAMLLEKKIQPDRNRARLFDQIFDFLLEGKHRPDHPPMAARNIVHQVLRHLAYAMTEDNAPTEPVTALESRLLDPDLALLRRKLEGVSRWQDNLRIFFDDLAERTGILGPYAGDDADWRYWHRTFREALTAERLEELLDEEGRDEVLTRAKEITDEEDASRWAEPYALLTGRVEEPDTLVRELVEANRPLGLRALASARTLREETVPEVLGLTGDADDRAKVYAELPRLFSEGRPLLALVDRLRRETRDGNDLFWLDWVARQVGARKEELRSEVEALLGRFFDHVPAPAEGLFTEVETPLDGVVPLWREILAGEFLMGSPESEEGRDDDEGPLHRVEIKSGFHMAAVPVTRVQYKAFDPEHRSSGFDGVAEEELAHHPVSEVTWWAAMAFCRWLGQVFPETAGARLPTEAEWEYACRAGRQTAYWSGGDEKDLDRVGWFDENSEGRTHRVGEKPANPWDLYDIHGNVWEWTVNRAYSDYSEGASGAVENPKAVSLRDEIGDDPGGGKRVIRGGSFADDARWARSAYRFRSHPRDGWLFLGFRVVLPAAPSGRS